MSFFLTTEQIRQGSKTVTRRNGWAFLKPGDIVNACVKCQGIPKGGKIEKIRQIRIISTRMERLDQINEEDVRKEGFPGFDTRGFIDMYCTHNKVKPEDHVNRIEFEYVIKKPIFISGERGSGKWAYAQSLITKGNKYILSPDNTLTFYLNVFKEPDIDLIFIDWPITKSNLFQKQLSNLIYEVITEGNMKDIFILSQLNPIPELIPFIEDKTSDFLVWANTPLRICTQSK